MAEARFSVFAGQVFVRNTPREAFDPQVLCVGSAHRTNRRKKVSRVEIDRDTLGQGSCEYIRTSASRSLAPRLQCCHVVQQLHIAVA